MDHGLFIPNRTAQPAIVVDISTENGKVTCPESHVPITLVKWWWLLFEENRRVRPQEPGGRGRVHIAGAVSGDGRDGRGIIAPLISPADGVKIIKRFVDSCDAIEILFKSRKSSFNSYGQRSHCFHYFDLSPPHEQMGMLLGKFRCLHVQQYR